ncbi:MAG TPA: efflux RND transporter periplasmic adaptor subunit [Gammaproteobacteria bacterium]
MKYVIVFVVALALGAGTVWLVTRDSGAPAGAAAVPGAPRPGPGAAGAGAPGGGFGAQQPPLVVVAPVTRQRLYDTVEALGTAMANESVTLTAKVTDTVRRVNFEDGDFVQAGDVLVELTNQEEEALLAEARANLEDAQKQLARLEDLAARGLAPMSELDVARSRAQASEARLNTVVARLQDRLIIAPFTGVLGFRQVSPGTLLTTNTPITTIDDISIIKLDFTVPETYLGAIHAGARVVARSVSYGDREFEGTVRTINSRVDPVTRAFTVRAHIPNEDAALRPGMLLSVEVVTGERLSLTVPEHAVFQIQDRAYVYRVDGERIAHQHEIKMGARRYGIVEVLEGLEEGDLIVVEGIIKLRDGVRVRYEDEGAAISDLPDSATSDLQDTARS